MCRRGELRPAAATLRAGVLGQLQLRGGGDHHGDDGAARPVRRGHEVSIEGAFVTLTRCAIMEIKPWAGESHFFQFPIICSPLVS